ncbi:imelysin family protein [Roseovarius albus]|uniref:imelysin family protein n=1 Tax=Roseovarius albus TaxID=1247867 RepID=UPI0013566E84|nr:imelysin family protein [Roseovarius albus]
MWPITTVAQDDLWSDQISITVKTQILHRFDYLEHSTKNLAKAAAQNCDPNSEVLRKSLKDGMWAWASASAFRFGPTETDNRAFALGFWPDTRGKTPKALRKLILDRDPIIESTESFTEASIAARGFYAMELMLYDPAFRDIGSPEYRCTLIQRQAADIARTANSIREDWEHYKTYLIAPSEDGPYRTQAGVKRELFKGVTTALEFTSDARLGRPLGSFDKPRPKRAEARRSGMSLELIEASLNSPWDMSIMMTLENEELSGILQQHFSKIKLSIKDLDDPDLSGVSDPASRFRIEALKQQIDNLRTTLADNLGPHLGVSAGFNSLDGD